MIQGCTYFGVISLNKQIQCESEKNYQAQTSRNLVFSKILQQECLSALCRTTFKIVEVIFPL